MASKRDNQAPAAQPKALSLHIGLNAVSPAAYSGWSGPLAACEFDANDMAAIARSIGIKPTVLLTKQGTRAKTLTAMRAAAKALGAGDFFFLSYSGHGGQVDDVTGEEPDKKDETWCLFDGQLIDDELYFELSKFKAGVRILVLSDSCHSGSVVRELPPQFDTLPHQRPKLMPPPVAMRVYREHQAFYDKLQNDIAEAVGKAAVDPDAVLANVNTAANVAVSGRLTVLVSQFKAAVLLISGCQDNQTSMDGDHNGAFTEQLLKVWNNGAFTGSYAMLHARIRAGLPPTQSPNLFTLGSAAKFVKQRPFSI
ncbi:MAG: peptidase [Rhodoferax sp.]|nr:peptidase [Rhodoferax sp.]